MYSQTNTSIIQPPQPAQQPLNIPPHLATKMNKHVKGFLFRKRFCSSLKQQLKEWEDHLYNHFVTKIAFNPRVNRVLYESPMNQYLSEDYSQYYNTNPSNVVQTQINKIKKYKNGFIIKYTSTPSPSLEPSSNSVNTFLSTAVSLYKGEVDLYLNEKTGKGELITRDGANSYGTWLRNSFTGWNRYVNKDGVLYIGTFMNSELNGKGIRVYQSSQNEPVHVYKGDFINYLRNGNGVDCFGNTKYEGGFVNDKRDGYGKIVFESGDVYEGSFKEDKFNGQGRYKWKNTGHEYIGDYLNGQFHGKGLYKWSENEYYKGEYKNGIKEGQGEVKYPDGKKFICPFVNGKPNGIGFYENGKGSRVEVQFIEGKINKKYKSPKKRN